MKKVELVCRFNLLPEELTLNIFSRLPIKSLMKSKCVCKTWNSSISNPHFINQHLSRAPFIGNPFIIFSTTDFLVDDNPNYPKPKVSLRQNCHFVEDIGGENEAVKPLQLDPVLSKLEIVGSCNGLLCLGDTSCYGDLITVYVCNPFTGESVQLPTLSSIPFESKHTLFGFGFDSVRNEYKVLRLIFHSLKVCLADCIVEAEVCTLGSDSWRRIGEAPFSPYGSEACVYVNGVIHCVATSIDDMEDFGIGYFYVGDEDLDFESLIPEMLPVWNENLDIGVLGGCLSVVNYSSLDFAEVWLFTDFFGKGEDKEEAWTRLFQLPIDNIVSLNLMCLLKSGEILFLSNHEELLSCHPFGGDARELGLHGMSETINGFVHVGTLVSPIMAPRS
ncbi:F-box family protein [Thalictrum thalictroides]|uniref:F-box family protein n=1 Tax=Thalictrum thalictroides TaxID=46969 RepID=A0A7J6VP99_THATH|nr:F-box family protein [Thalictrum thalictroides]